MSKQKSKVDVTREKAPPAPVPADPWAPLTSLRSEIDRLFDDFGPGFWRQPLARRMHGLLPGMADWPLSPAVELVDCGDAFRITAELPGMAPGDVEIRLGDGTLSIRGEKSEEKKEEKEDYLLSERRYGAFHRSLALPSGIDADAVAAEVSNGILTVTLPKSAEARQKERKIEVKAA